MARGDDGDRIAVGPGQIGDHQGRARLPWNAAQRGQVGRHHHVAVTGFPVRHGIAGHGVHVDVDGQQITAALGAVRGHLVDEELTRHPFADQSALHVGERHDDGVDVAGRDQSFEVGLGENRCRRRRACLPSHDRQSTIYRRAWPLPAAGAQHDLGGQLCGRFLRVAPPEQVHHPVVAEDESLAVPCRVPHDRRNSPARWSRSPPAGSCRREPRRRRRPPGDVRGQWRPDRQTAPAGWPPVPRLNRRRCDRRPPPPTTHRASRGCRSPIWESAAGQRR